MTSTNWTATTTNSTNWTATTVNATNYGHFRSCILLSNDTVTLADSTYTLRGFLDGVIDQYTNQINWTEA